MKYTGAPATYLLNADKVLIFRKIFEYAVKNDIKVIIVDYPNVDFVSGPDKYSGTVNKIVSEYGMLYVNKTTKFNRSYDLFSDINHFNVKGRTIFSDTIAQEIKKIL